MLRTYSFILVSLYVLSHSSTVTQGRITIRAVFKRRKGGEAEYSAAAALLFIIIMVVVSNTWRTLGGSLGSLDPPFKIPAKSYSFNFFSPIIID